MSKPTLNGYRPKHVYQDYKFTIPKGGYYEFILFKDGKSYKQIVLGKSLKDAQNKLKPDMWETNPT